MPLRARLRELRSTISLELAGKADEATLLSVPVERLGVLATSVVQVPLPDECAWIHSDKSWKALRERNAKEHHLVLPCCSSSVVLKQSPLGTKFFAHSRKGECTSAPETAEHLKIKSGVAEAVREAGWQVQTEAQGTTPDGEQWVADVLCWKPGSAARIAIEVQWSHQSLEETQRRQERYKASGVRGLWLMKNNNVPSCQEIPAAQVYLTKTGEPRIHLTIQPTPPMPEIFRSSVSLFEFVTGALQGRLKYEGETAVICLPEGTLYAGSVPCRNCGKIRRAFQYVSLPLYPGESDRFDLHRFRLESSDPQKSSPIFEWANRRLRPVLDKLGVAPIRLRKERVRCTPRSVYAFIYRSWFVNVCNHCGAEQTIDPPCDRAEAVPVGTLQFIEVCVKGEIEKRWVFKRAPLSEEHPPGKTKEPNLSVGSKLNKTDLLARGAT